MVDAYLHAESGQPSPEIAQLQAIDRFGVKAVMHRDTLYAGEIFAMRTAETIYKGYRARQRAEDITEFHRKNPALMDLLVKVEKLLNE